MNRLTTRAVIASVSAIAFFAGTFAGGLAPAAAAEEAPPKACQRIDEIEENIQARVTRVEARMARIETRIEVLNEKLADRPVRLEKKLAKAEVRMQRAQGQFDRLHARWDRVLSKCGVPADEAPIHQGSLEEPLQQGTLDVHEIAL